MKLLFILTIFLLIQVCCSFQLSLYWQNYKGDWELVKQSSQPTKARAISYQLYFNNEIEHFFKFIIDLDIVDHSINISFTSDSGVEQYNYVHSNNTRVPLKDNPLVTICPDWETRFSVSKNNYNNGDISIYANCSPVKDCERPTYPPQTNDPNAPTEPPAYTETPAPSNSTKKVEQSSLSNRLSFSFNLTILLLLLLVITLFI
ncbi:hypothetical protein CYY_001786 [Polysphondylium violaceum]|uniref:Uncharacterized protein n=1 Tax=Polysphondylium violaceum TaxID=133409 RepID=A0A8J4Q2M1_9MYCE|nr:hypothetical protein CYY_001786 [Polysphondylium violaceum]